jgi:dihydropteroate synthase
MHWELRRRSVPLDRPFILGILNVTPDSFSDGGRFSGPGDAVAYGERLLDEGADAVDVGGESTRPQNAIAIDADEELHRVLPVVRELRRRRPDALISVDTPKRVVARAILAEGADAINDVSGLRLDPEVGDACAAAGAGLILMHSRGMVSEMGTYLHASYGADPVGEIVGELAAAVARAEEAEVPRARLVVDPGVGFAKRTEHSVAVLRGLPRVAALGLPVLVGASRKRIVQALTGVEDPAARAAGSVGLHVAALARGARLFRVHDVRAHREALDAAWAVLGEQGPGARGEG